MRGRPVRPGGGALLMSLILVVTMAAGPPAAGAATVVREWKAKVGTAGMNGTATMQTYTTGAGAAVLKLTRLRASTTLPVVVSKGTCASVGSTIVKLPSVRSSTTGAVSKTLGMTAAQVTAVTKASAAGKMAFRVGTSSTGGTRCGVIAIVPRPPVVGATTTVGADPTDVVVAPGGVYVTNWWDNTLSKIDPVANRVLATIPLDITGVAGPQAIAYGEGSLWVTVTAWDSTGEDALPGSLLRLDPVTGETVATIPMGRYPGAVVTSPGAVWVANHWDSTIMRVDPTTNAVIATITVDGYPHCIAYGAGAIWAPAEIKGLVSRIDPATNTVVATIPTVGEQVGVAVGGGSVWVANWGTTGQADGVVSRIDPATNTVVRTIPAGTNPAWISFGGGYAWVGLYFSPTVVQIDPATNTVKANVTTGPPVMDTAGVVIGLRGIAATDSSVWVVQPYPYSSVGVVPPGRVVRIYF